MTTIINVQHLDLETRFMTARKGSPEESEAYFALTRAEDAMLAVNLNGALPDTWPLAVRAPDWVYVQKVCDALDDFAYEAEVMHERRQLGC
jgi:hypothetical protein